MPPFLGSPDQVKIRDKLNRYLLGEALLSNISCRHFQGCTVRAVCLGLYASAGLFKSSSGLRQSCQANAQRLSLRNLGHSGSLCCVGRAFEQTCGVRLKHARLIFLCRSYILFFTGGLWGWCLYFSLLYFCGWFVRALLILYAWAEVLAHATGLHSAQS